MKHAVLALAIALPASAWAAEVKTSLLDHSNAALIDSAGALAVMKAAIPAKVWKLYPRTKYVFLSQVEGGVNAARTCVVAARVMVLPLTPTMRAPLFRPLPKLTATAYDSIANASAEQCKVLAKDKLKQATEAVVSNIVKT